MGIKSKPSGGMSFDAILLTFIKLITVTLGLVITRMLSEYLSVHDYGTYSQILLIVSTVSSITIFGMMDAANYFYCREQDEERKESYVTTILALQCTVGCAAGCAVIFLSVPICKYFDNPDIKNLIIFASSLPLLQNMMGIFQVLCVAAGKARMLALRNLVVSLARLGAVFIVVLIVNNIVVVLLTQVLLDIGQIVFFWLILRKSGYRFRFSKIDESLVWDILKYCAPMAIFIMVKSLNRDMDKYLVSMMTDTETLALYANASKQLPFDILMASFCTVLIPYITKYISEQKKKQAAELYRLFLEIAYISTGIVCCAALAAAPQLMKLLYSNKYTDGIAIFVIYIVVDLLSFTNLTVVLSAAGKTKTLMVIGLGAVLCNFVINTVLYNWLGLIGPAIATLIVTVLFGMIMFYFNSRTLGIKISDFFDLKYLTLFVAESVVLTVALYFLSRYLEKIDVHYFVILMIVAGLYGIIMIVFNGKRLWSALKNANRRSLEKYCSYKSDE